MKKRDGTKQVNRGYMNPKGVFSRLLAKVVFSLENPSTYACVHLCENLKSIITEVFTKVIKFYVIKKIPA